MKRTHEYNEEGESSFEASKLQVIEKTHPDGGWGWIVVIAAFLTQFVVVGLQNSSGVIFKELVEMFDGSGGNTGFVSSIACGMMFLLGPVTTALCQRFGCRKIAGLGGFLCCVGMVCSAHASKLSHMIISFGFIWGLGSSFCYFPTLIILVPYFDKRLALVNGMVSAGSGTGTLVLSICIQLFAKRYGVQKLFYALAFLHGMVLLAGFLYRPINKVYRIRQGIEVKEKVTNVEKIPRRQYTKETLLSRDSQMNINRYNRSDSRSDGEETEVSNLSDLENSEQETSHFQKTLLGLKELFHDKAFISWCLGLSVFILGYFVPFVHLVHHATLIGIKDTKAASLISIISITATIFKVLSGTVAGLEKVNTLKLYQFSLLVMGVSTTMIPVSHYYSGLVIYSIVFGIGESCFIVMIPLITKEIVGVQRLPLALGCVFMSMGIPTVFAAPIAGWIYDAFKDYSYAFYVAGMMNIVGVLIMFLVVFFKQEGNLRKKVEEERRRFREDTEKQSAASKTIVLTSFTSTERIYVSQRDISIPFEDTLRRPVSKIIEYTSFASSERIYLSNRDIRSDIYPSNNNLGASQKLPPLNFPTPQISTRFNRPESICLGDAFNIPDNLTNSLNRRRKRRPLSLQFESQDMNTKLLSPLIETTMEKENIISEEEEDVEIRPESPAILAIEPSTVTYDRTRNYNFFIRIWSSIFFKTFSRSSERRTVTVVDERLMIDSKVTVL